MNNLAISYDQAGDVATARKWWSKAADHDHADAMFILGAFFDEEDNDRETARQLWRRAAELGHGLSSFNLGCTFVEDGDFGEGLQWWRHAAALGDARAQSALREHGAAETDE